MTAMLHRPNHAKASEVTSEHPTESSVTRRVLAVLRIATGFIFLWAFLDKTFGLSYSTPNARAWIHGGSPTKGFLSNVEVGPLQSFFHSIAGNPITDWLFMLGLLGVGVALIVGAGLRLAAVGATLMMAMMWIAEWPLAQTTATGDPSGSTNPIVDYHVIYALVAIVCALSYAGRTWGISSWWERVVGKNRWLV